MTAEFKYVDFDMRNALRVEEVSGGFMPLEFSRAIGLDGELIFALSTIGLVPSPFQIGLEINGEPVATPTSVKAQGVTLYQLDQLAQMVAFLEFFGKHAASVDPERWNTALQEARQNTEGFPVQAGWAEQVPDASGLTPEMFADPEDPK